MNTIKYENDSNNTIELPIANNPTDNEQFLPEISEDPTFTLGKAFTELGLSAELIKALHAEKRTHSFPIQELTLPLTLSGQDIIGQARTGTGKTLCYALPIIDYVRDLPNNTANRPYALILVPTRELCLQVHKEISALLTRINKLRNDNSSHTKNHLKAAALYGGQPIAGQRQELDCAQIIVATPGRLLDFLGDNGLDLESIKIAVIDETDEMLDLGFLPEVIKIFSFLPDQRQTMLFSATLPTPIMTLARDFLNQPTHVQAENHDEAPTHRNVVQHVYRAHNLDKDELVARILQARNRGSTIIFTRTKRQAAKLSDELKTRGFKVGALHGDLPQQLREKYLSLFRAQKIDVLVATDVAARGIDIVDITHVINYQIPDDDSTYIHRIGRTARAGKSGIAITLVDWEDLARWKLINIALGLNYSDPQETYSTSDHLYADLDIPEGTQGSLTTGESQNTDSSFSPTDDMTIGSDQPARKTRSRNHRSGSNKNNTPAHKESAKKRIISSSANKTTSAPSIAEHKNSENRQRRRRIISSDDPKKTS